MAIVFALIAMVAWALGDVFGTLASRKRGNFITLFWMLLFSFVLSVLYIPWAGGISDWGVFIATFFISLLAFFGMVTYFRGLEVGNVSLVGAIGGSFGMVTVPLTMIIFHESVGRIAVLGMGLIFIGIILSSFDFRLLINTKTRAIFSDKGVILALNTLICWGIYYAVIRYPIERLGWFWSWFPTSLMFVILFFIGSIRRKIPQSSKDGTFLIWAFLFGVGGVGGTIAYYLAIIRGYTSIVVPIATSSPVLFVILSRFIFRDRLTKQQWMGIGMTLLGIVMLGFSQV